MPVELAEVAAGLPLACSFALASGISHRREGRRRAALNEAVHELRRPLQVLSLALPEQSEGSSPAGSSLRLAAAALDRLECEINGVSVEAVATRVSVRALLDEAAERWRGRASASGGDISVRWWGEESVVAGDRSAIAQAVDNLISNAIVHGGGRVTLEGKRVGRECVVTVRDAGGAQAALPPGRGDRHRHGHGLRVVARAARAHGGSFRLRRWRRGCEAQLRLPLLAGGEER